MTVATRVTLFSLLIGIFIAAMVLAIGGLVVLGNPTAGLVAVIATVACVVAGVISWLVGRTVRQQLALDEEQEQRPLPVVANRPLQMQSLPVAELPPEYLEAVMRGVRANRQALKSGARQA